MVGEINDDLCCMIYDDNRKGDYTIQHIISNK